MARFGQVKVTIGAQILIVLALGCADAPRENIIDPVNVATIEVSTPVLDGGAVRVEWRYLNEGTDLTEFRIDRIFTEFEQGFEPIPVEVVTEVARVSASRTSGSDWRAESFRDTAFITGVNVTYRISGLLSDGSVRTNASSGVINVPGTFLNPVFGNATDLVLMLNWEDVPSGVAGFQVLRTQPGGEPELIFASDDRALRTYVDPIQVGNVTYAYQVVSLLEGGGAMHSTPKKGGLFEVVASDDPIRPRRLGESIIISARGEENLESVSIHVSQDEMFASLDAGFSATQGIIAANGGDYDAGSLSGSFAILDTQQLDDQFRPHFYHIAGFDANGSEAFLDVYERFWDVHETMRWPATGTRTAMAHFGRNHLLLSAGDLLRLLSDSLKVEEQVILADGEPLDIEYQSGSIWLAYEDRLLKSNSTEDLAGISDWERLPIPTGIKIQTISLFRDDMIVLDSVNRKVYLVGDDGSVRLTWDTIGVNPVADVIGANNRLVQVDANFVGHLILADGVERL